MMQVNIVSQESELFNQQASFVTAPAVLGEVGITPNHAPFISPLQEGQVSVTLADGSQQQIFISGGFIEVQPKVVTILSDTALRSDDIDEEKMLENQRQAREVLERAKTDLDVAKAQSMLANATAKVEMISHLRDKLKKKGY